MKRRFIAVLLLISLAFAAYSCGESDGRDGESGVSGTASEAYLPSEEVSESSDESLPEEETMYFLAACSNKAYYTASKEPKNGGNGFLTDGLTDDLALYDRGFEEYAVSGKALDITVDLGKVTDGLTEYELYYLIDGTSYADISLLTVSVSVDGSEFTAVSSQKGTAHPSRIDDLCVIKAVSEKTSGRYVRFTVKPKNASSLKLCELIVFRSASLDIPDEPKEADSPAKAPETITVPHATMTFIAGIELAGSTAEEYDEYFDNLQDAGITGIVLLNGAGSDGNIMSRSAFDNIYAQAEKRNMHVFAGLQMAGDEIYDDPASYIKTAEKTINNFISAYKDAFPTAFYGWYFNQELNNNVYSTKPDKCAELLNGVVGAVNRLAPDMPVLLSPFSVTWAGDGAKLEKDLWKVFEKVSFRPIDIYCPQDSVGAALIPLERSREYLEAAKKCCDKKGIRFGVNVENFSIRSSIPDGEEDIPAPVSRFVKQMEIASEFTDIIGTFTYESYSPEPYGSYTVFNDKPYFHSTYINYLATGKVDEFFPENISVITSDGNACIFFETPTYGCLALNVENDGLTYTLGRHYFKEAGKYSYICFNVNTEKVTSVRLYDYAAECSPQIRFDKNGMVKAETYKVDRTLEPVNVALGCDYTSPGATHSNNDSGKELTDGIYGKADFGDPAWSGYNDTTYSFVIDLGKTVEGLADFRVSLLGGGLGAIYEPSSIRFDVSENGTDYVSVGEAVYTSQGGSTLYKTSMGVSLDEGVNGRYVRVTVKCYGWCFMDEIEVIKYGE